MLSTAKQQTKEQFALLKALGAARDFGTVKDTLGDVQGSCKANTDAYIKMIKSAFMAQEPTGYDHDDEDTSESRVSLKNDQDFIAYKESHPRIQNNVQISWQALATNVLFRATLKQLMAHMGLDSVEYAKKLAPYMRGVPDGIKAEDVKLSLIHI